MKKMTDSNASFPRSDTFTEQQQVDTHDGLISTTARPGVTPNVRPPRQHRRRYQLHLWINEREYTLLKNLAEFQDEPMSRIVRRLFSHLEHLVDRVERKAS